MAEEKKTNKTTTNFVVPLLVVLLAVAAFLAGSFWTKIQYLKSEEGEGGREVAQASPAPQAPEEGAVLGEELPSTLGNFLVTKDEFCQEDGKPAIYMFGSNRCPHCTWEHPIFEKVVAKFAGQISVHDNMDKQEDMEIFQKYSQVNRGAIPFLVLGCRYARVGSGESVGEIEEEKNLTALICKLTDGLPEKVCLELKDLVGQIED